jgi:hypothetical protein
MSLPAQTWWLIVFSLILLVGTALTLFYLQATCVPCQQRQRQRARTSVDTVVSPENPDHLILIPLGPEMCLEAVRLPDTFLDQDVTTITYVTRYPREDPREPFWTHTETHVVEKGVMGTATTAPAPSVRYRAPAASVSFPWPDTPTTLSVLIASDTDTTLQPWFQFESRPAPWTAYLYHHEWSLDFAAVNTCHVVGLDNLTLWNESGWQAYLDVYTSNQGWILVHGQIPLLVDAWGGDLRSLHLRLSDSDVSLVKTVADARVSVTLTRRGRSERLCPQWIPRLDGVQPAHLLPVAQHSRYPQAMAPGFFAENYGVGSSQWTWKVSLYIANHDWTVNDIVNACMSLVCAVPVVCQQVTSEVNPQGMRFELLLFLDNTPVIPSAILPCSIEWSNAAGYSSMFYLCFQSQRRKWLQDERPPGYALGASVPRGMGAWQPICLRQLPAPYIKSLSVSSRVRNVQIDAERVVFEYLCDDRPFGTVQVTYYQGTLDDIVFSTVGPIPTDLMDQWNMVQRNWWPYLLPPDVSPRVSTGCHPLYQTRTSLKVLDNQLVYQPEANRTPVVLMPSLSATPMLPDSLSLCEVWLVKVSPSIYFLGVLWPRRHAWITDMDMERITWNRWGTWQVPDTEFHWFRGETSASLTWTEESSITLWHEVDDVVVQAVRGRISSISFLQHPLYGGFLRTCVPRVTRGWTWKTNHPITSLVRTHVISVGAYHVLTLGTSSSSSSSSTIQLHLEPQSPTDDDFVSPSVVFAVYTYVPETQERRRCFRVLASEWLAAQSGDELTSTTETGASDTYIIVAAVEDSPGTPWWPRLGLENRWSHPYQTDGWVTQSPFRGEYLSLRPNYAEFYLEKPIQCTWSYEAEEASVS